MLNTSTKLFKDNNDTPIIRLFEHHSIRRRTLIEIITSCDATPQVESFCNNYTIENDSNPLNLFAVVALGSNMDANLSSFNIINQLSKVGYTVVAYEDNTSLWPLGLQCKSLIAGAKKLFDSKSINFVSDLKSYLTTLISDKKRQFVSDVRTKDDMRELGIISESIEMLILYRDVLKISKVSDFPTLITGETGTGKELFAKAIYKLDRKRCNGEFIALNCSAISSGIAESELFGHRRGAFTGADRERRGLIRSANGGVLFLDEVGELDILLQSKLLRVIQENRVLSLGEDQENSINIRIIAATNRNLNKMCKDGTFRTDLFHRLNSLSINIPPLRERPADIKPLVEHFILKYSSLGNRPSILASQDYISAFANLELPGNVRQLENVVRWSIVNKTDNSPLCLNDLPNELIMELANQTTSQNDENTTGKNENNNSQFSAQLLSIHRLNNMNLAKSLDYCEKIIIESTLKETKGNQSSTARILKLTPRSIYNKIRKYNLHQFSES